MTKLESAIKIRCQRGSCLYVGCRECFIGGGTKICGVNYSHEVNPQILLKAIEYIESHNPCICGIINPMEQIIMDIKKDIMTNETCSTIKNIKLELLTTIKARYDLVLMGKKEKE